MMKKIILKKGREETLKRRHPWLFSGAVAKVEEKPAQGETVLICAHDGKPLATGFYSPHSQIRVRVWDFSVGTVIDEAFFRLRLQTALQQRAGIGADTNAMRLIFSEADDLPGLIVDRYADTLVCQFLSAGIEYHKELVVKLLSELVECKTIYDRSDTAVREKEGLKQTAGLLNGRDVSDTIEIHEHGVKFLVDIQQGHKTGFYLDQRDNRIQVRAMSSSARVLNCFSYTGGFGLAALAGGAEHVVNLDSSGPALELVARNAALNYFDPSRYENIDANAFEQLRRFKNEGREFDIIVLDPPKFVEHKGQLKQGARAYKDINMQAFKLLKPGGLLFTFSCSGLVPASLFQKIVADAALDAGCSAQIIKSLGQAVDHPVSLNFPEAEYLKGFCIRKTN